MTQFSRKFHSLNRNFTFARIISFTGSSFSEFAIPLFLLSSSENPLHIALQWSILASARFFSGFISPYLSFMKHDRNGIIILDVLQGIAILIPVVFRNTSPLVACYVATVFLALFSTLQQGFITSLINQLSLSETEPHAAKQRLNGSIESGRNFGMLVGYGAAYWISAKLGFCAAFVIDSVSYLLSAGILAATPILNSRENHVLPSQKEKRSYSLLFLPQLRYLTVSQMLLSFAVFLFNGSFIFHMKQNLKATDGVIALLFVSQYFGYTSGNLCASKTKQFPKHMHPWIRVGLAIIFIGFAFSESPVLFILWNTLLSMLLGVSQPAIMVLFQEGVATSEQRSMGSARTALVSIVGAIGAALSGYLLGQTESALVFFIGAGFCVLSAATFKIFSNGKRSYGYEQLL